MTAADIIARAKWLAREHAAELDPVPAADWLLCLADAWRRLWGLHPEAFHAADVRAGSMPAVPASTSATVTLADGWEPVLAAGAALAAVRALRPADEAQAALLGQTVKQLEAAFAAGLGAP